jgi:hypothetical protein
MADQSMRGRRGLGCLPRPKLQPDAIHALLWMLYMAEVTQYGLPHQLTADGWVTPAQLPPAPPCICRYRVHTTSVVLTVRRRPVRHQLVTGTGFEIDPACEHHGDLRRVEYFDATYTDVLDEDERRNH